MLDQNKFKKLFFKDLIYTNIYNKNIRYYLRVYTKYSHSWTCNNNGFNNIITYRFY